MPRVERIAQGAPNAPYEVRGESYDPENADVPIAETGVASWYGKPFHGRRTANGEIYDMHAMSAAHKTMPLPSYARVRNPANGREVIVRINDRGPFKPGRIIDLSHAAAKRLRISGLARVEGHAPDACHDPQRRVEAAGDARRQHGRRHRQVGACGFVGGLAARAAGYSAPCRPAGAHREPEPALSRRPRRPVSCDQSS